MAQIYESVPNAAWLVASGAVAAVVALSCLGWAIAKLRRAQLSTRVQLVAKVLLVISTIALWVVPALTVWLTAVQRGLFRSAIEAASVAPQPALFDQARRSLSAALNTVPFGLIMVWPAALFVAAPAIVLLTKLIWSAPTADGASDKPVRWWVYLLATGAWTYGGGLFPVASVTKYCAEAIAALSIARDIEIGSQEQFVLTTLETAGRDLSEALIQAALLMIVPLVAGIVLIVVLDEEPAAEAPGVDANWWAGAACCVAAAVVFVAAAPLRAENAQPLPHNPMTLKGSLPTPTVTLPDIPGTDPVEISPILQLDDTRVWLDGLAIEAHDVGVYLSHLRERAGADFSGRVAVMCDAKTPTKRLNDLLVPAHEAGYSSVQLLVGHESIVERPLLGKVKRDTYAAISFTFVVDRADVTAKHVTDVKNNSPSKTCGDLARGLAEQRAHGQPVGLMFTKNDP